MCVLITSRNPGPPSDIGRVSISQLGQAVWIPRLIAAVTCRAVRLSLNSCGAISTRI